MIINISKTKSPKKGLNICGLSGKVKFIHSQVTTYHTTCAHELTSSGKHQTQNYTRGFKYLSIYTSPINYKPLSTDALEALHERVVAELEVWREKDP